MIVDLVGLTKLGDMASGGGLKEIFDEAKTTGSAQSTTGYAGVVADKGKVLNFLRVTVLA